MIKRRNFLPQSCPDLAICSCYFCLVVILRYVWNPRTRYQTFARAGFKIVHQNVRDILSNNHLLK